MDLEEEQGELQLLCPFCSELLFEVHNDIGYCPFCDGKFRPDYIKGNKRHANDSEIAQYRQDIVKTLPNGAKYTVRLTPNIG